MSLKFISATHRSIDAMIEFHFSLFYRKSQCTLDQSGFSCTAVSASVSASMYLEHLQYAADRLLNNAAFSGSHFIASEYNCMASSDFPAFKVSLP